MQPKVFVDDDAMTSNTGPNTRMQQQLTSNFLGPNALPGDMRTRLSLNDINATVMDNDSFSNYMDKPLSQKLVYARDAELEFELGGGQMRSPSGRMKFGDSNAMVGAGALSPSAGTMANPANAEEKLRKYSDPYVNSGKRTLEELLIQEELAIKQQNQVREIAQL